MKNNKFLDITMAIITIVCLFTIFFIEEFDSNINFSFNKKYVDVVLFIISGTSSLFIFIINYIKTRACKHGTNEKKLSFLDSISMLILSISCFLLAAVIYYHLSSYLLICMAIVGLLCFVIIVPITKILINKKENKNDDNYS